MLFRKANNRRTDPERAERILNQSLETLRDQQADNTTPLSFLKTRLEAQAAQQASRKDTAMSLATRLFANHRVSGITAIIALAIILGGTMIPFSYMKTVGYTVAFSLPSDQAISDPNQLASAMSTLGLNDVWVNYNIDGESTVWTLSNLPDQKAATTAAAAFRTMTGTDAEPDITPVLKEVSGSLYAQVVEELREITITTEVGGTPEEIEEQIRDQLIDAGFEPGAIHVITNEVDGTVIIDLEVTQ
ncbi:MAG: hypothetical protein AB1483_14220 [Candidatus Zixiibacteriota bacterium]